MQQPTLAIIGGGISGLILSIALHERGVRAEIYEQAPHFGEIGSGVAFGANAIHAMRYCSPKVVEAFRAVAPSDGRARDLSGRLKWFDFVDGYHDNPDEPQHEKWLFDLMTSDGGGVHRAHFLDELIKYAPKDIAHFGKHLERIDEIDGGMLRMRFRDGVEVDVDSIIGCDGIKSKVRQIIFGADNPVSHPVYTHMKAYRGLIPMERAAGFLGTDKAENSYIHLGHRGHIITYPVAKGKALNVVAFQHDDGDWPSDTKLTLPSKKEHVLEDFRDFGPTPRKIIEMLEPELDCWAIYDTGSHPCPYFNMGRICLLGDAAHATAPHHGAGAGFCVEDAAVMSTLLARARSKSDYAKAFELFNVHQRERTQWLVQSSRKAGNLYNWMDSECGDNAEKIAEELKWRMSKIWNVDTGDMIRAADEDMVNAVQGGVEARI